MDFRIKPIASMTLAALLSYSYVAEAAPSVVSASAGQQKAISTQNSQQELVDLTQREVTRVIGALKNFYVANTGAWPANLTSINPYYSGDYKTPIGTITGATSASGYQLTINTSNLDAQFKAKIESMAARNQGSMTGNSVTFSIDAPQNAAIVRSMLSRYADPDGSGELNKMYANLNMNNNSVDGVNQLNAQDVISNTATVNNATITNATIATLQSTLANVDTLNAKTANLETLITDTFSTTDLVATTATMTTADVIDALTVGGALTANGVVTANNTLNVNGAVNANNGVYANGTLVIDAASRLYHQGQNLDTRFLGINATAVDSDKLGGIGASQFARNDVSNTFSGRQYFNGGANVVGTLNTQAINATGKIYTSNDIQSRYVYASNANINGTWLTDTINKANSSYSRVGTLEGKVSNLERAGGNTGTWSIASQIQPGALISHVRWTNLYAETYRQHVGKSCMKGLAVTYIYDGGHDDPDESITIICK
ncbi:hypothetical protein EA007_06520 [Vibrio anguillarum]|uniref:hypothetical protein n=2 Tax=Vibrio anguillarum TaxID=55601 RepID=UPI00188D6CCA|nr:hypothetical protein [Vibrio anguillarum]MBF4250648.1 hypothetical protein [Vibrio anguillarum]